MFSLFGLRFCKVSVMFTQVVVLLDKLWSVLNLKDWSNGVAFNPNERICSCWKCFGSPNTDGARFSGFAHFLTGFRAVFTDVMTGVGEVKNILQVARWSSTSTSTIHHHRLCKLYLPLHFTKQVWRSNEENNEQLIFASKSSRVDRDYTDCLVSFTTFHFIVCLLP